MHVGRQAAFGISVKLQKKLSGQKDGTGERRTDRAAAQGVMTMERNQSQASVSYFHPSAPTTTTTFVTCAESNEQLRRHCQGRAAHRRGRRRRGEEESWYAHRRSAICHEECVTTRQIQTPHGSCLLSPWSAKRIKITRLLLSPLSTKTVRGRQMSA